MSGPTSETLVNEWTWKTPAMRSMAAAVLRLAISRPGDSFSAIDLPEHGAEEHGGTGIAGSIFRQLADAGIIAPVGAFVEGEFLQRRVRNAGGNPIGLWRLSDFQRAHSLLQRHGGSVVRQEQVEMELTNARLQRPGAAGETDGK